MMQEGRLPELSLLSFKILKICIFIKEMVFEKKNLNCGLKKMVKYITSVVSTWRKSYYITKKDKLLNGLAQKNEASDRIFLHDLVK